ncbi:MAG: Cache 3/Cache 2 fusion domain-containing protein [Desulfarculus sp.]|nr:Cache 3/Cache 2 fusion domain-containing protein [Desulfarculus sp.]
MWRPRLKGKLLGAVGALALMGLASLSLIHHWVAVNHLQEVVGADISARADLLLKEVGNHHQTMLLHRQQDYELVMRDLTQLAQSYLQYIQTLHQDERDGRLTRTEAQERARHFLLGQRVGQTGYPFVWDVSQAPDFIPLVVHPSLQGQDMAWVEFVREGALKKRGYLEYMWANPGDRLPRPKAAALEYFEPWQWVICVSAYKSEFPIMSTQAFYQAADQALTNDIKAMRVGENGYAFVINWAGGLVIHPNGPTGDLEPPELIQTLLRQGDGLVRWEENGRAYLVAFRTFAPSGWVLAIKAREDDFLAPVRAGLVRWGLVILLGFLALTVVVLVPLLGRLVIDPARRLAKLADRIAGGQLELDEPQPRGGDEMADLARSLQAMAGRLRQSVSYLAQSERRYRDLFTHSPEPGFVLNRSGFVVEVNPAMEQALGRPAQAVVGRHFSRFLSPGQLEGLRRSVLKAMRQGKVVTNLGLTLLGPKGQPRFLEGFLTPLGRGGRVEGFFGLARDLTEQRRLEQQLRRAQKMEILGTLAGGLAHDFNNLLSGILGYASLLLSQGDLTPRQRRYLMVIDHSAGRAAQLTQQLLSLSKSRQIHPEPVRLGELMAEVLAILGHSFPADLEVQLWVEPDLPPLEADAGQIHQALMNLCINARDAMPQGGRIELRAALESTGPDSPPEVAALGPRVVHLSVVDNGPGMDQATQQQALEPFFTTKEHGTGLGLPMVSSIVQGHGGVMRLESAPGQGTAAHLYFTPGRAGEAAPARARARVPRPTPGQRILVVDDEKVVREMAQEILEFAGFLVTTAADGEQALRHLRQHPQAVDLVLLDVVMPGLSGLEVLRLIKLEQPWIKVVLASGMFEQSQDDAQVWRQSDGRLGKPYRAEDLLATLDQVLQRGGSAAEQADGVDETNREKRHQP